MSVLCHLSPRTGSELGAAPSVPAAPRIVTIVGSFPSCVERGLCPEQRRGVQWPLQTMRRAALLSEQGWQPGLWTGSSEGVLSNLQKVPPSGTVSTLLIVSLEVECRLQLFLRVSLPHSPQSPFVPWAKHAELPASAWLARQLSALRLTT